MAQELGENRLPLIVSVLAGLTLGFIFYFNGREAWAVGVFSGTAAGVANFWLLFQHLASLKGPVSAGAAGPKKTPGLTAVLFMMRYLILAGVFYFVYLRGNDVFVSFLAGFFLVQMSLGLTALKRLFRPAA